MDTTTIREEYEGDVIPLSQAALCCNCEAITVPRNGRCRACGSESVLILARVLNREVAA